jgi:hypothetical protein
VVDGPEPGAGGHHHGQPEIDGQVAHEVAGGDRHHEAADPLDYEQLVRARRFE